MSAVPRVVVVGAVALLAVLADAATSRSGDATKLQPLQPLIDGAAAGDIVTPPPGRYTGPVVITRAITLDGGGVVTIDGGGRGTVVSIKTDGATVRGLTVIGSGDLHNDLDAGIRIEGSGNVVKDNEISECLFGIDLQSASGNILRRNRITSKGDADLGIKGDAIRLWYSDDNRIEENTVTGSRDLVVWYSSRNIIARNQVSDGRYGLHFMFAKRNLVEDNRFDRNLVGIYLMYNEGDVLRRNRVFQAQGSAGVGIGFKEASNIAVEDNEIVYNAVGLSFDISPFQPGSTIRLIRNRIAFNDIGVSFLSDRVGNGFLDNQFVGNTQQVAMRLYERAAHAVWDGNYWDDYEGFDRDGDGIGDRPHVMRSYADRLWMDVPPAALFKGTPALSMLDFIERLAPFSEPLQLLADAKPRMSRNFAPRTHEELAALYPVVMPVDSDDAEGGGRSDAPPESAYGERLDPFGLYKN